ncbi:dual specificity protein phosphatase DSP8 [Canna indica]|uniref:phosphatidylglycerophosphatase n=1 Tax=Canna indica TaxID=4628 RepID=A0AAQ3JS99_9LILI|nr:dual specificity protein phosphatase DSP8 [Canna indica]
MEDIRITELEDGESDDICDSGGREIVPAKAKRAIVGAGARILFYPTLLYNVFRNKIQAEFRWWDEVDQFLLLGAVPFPKDVPRLQRLGVQGVVTLNEPYETLVPSSLYQTHGIDNLVIPTRDYLFAPSPGDIGRAVDFIHRNASSGRTTYVHCKAGRGRSTTIVLCYLVKYKNMTPADALEYVRSRRPRVLLAPSQWRAVEDFNKQRMEGLSAKSYPLLLSGGDAVVITEADLEGYGTGEFASRELKPASYRIARAKPMIARLSCLFSALKATSGCPTVPSRLPEIRAC